MYYMDQNGEDQNLEDRSEVLSDHFMGRLTTLPKWRSMVSTNRCMNSRIASSFCKKPMKLM